MLSPATNFERFLRPNTHGIRLLPSSLIPASHIARLKLSTARLRFIQGPRRNSWTRYRLQD